MLSLLKNFWLVILLAILIPMFFILNIDGNISFNFLLLYSVILWSSVRLAYSSIIGQRRLTLMFFYVFVYVFMGVQPLVSTWTDRFPHSELSPSYDLYTYTVIVVIMGIIAFEVGYARWKLSATGIKTHQLDSIKGIDKNRRISISRLWIVIIFITSLVLLSILYYGINIYLSLRDGAAFSEDAGREMSGTEAQLVINSLRVLVSILLFIALSLKKMQKLKLAFNKGENILFIIIFLIILNLIVSNPLNAPRLWSGSVILTCIFISISWNTRTSFRRYAIAFSLGMLLLFSGTDPRRIFSYTLMRGEEIGVGSVGRSIVEGVASLPYDTNFDAFQMITYTKIYTDQLGYSWGYQTLLPIFFWIPRSQWPSKPVGTSDVVGKHAGFFNVNVSSPIFSEGYVNFGMAGVVLFLMLFGRAARLGDNSLSQKTIRPVFPTIISSYFAANTFILMRGDLTSGTMYLQMMVGFTFIILFFITKDIKSTTIQVNQSAKVFL